MNMHGPSHQNCSARDSPLADGCKFRAWKSSKGRHQSMLKHIAIDQTDLCVSRVAESCRIFRDCFHYRLDIRRRAGDYTQNFTRRSLLLQRFLKLLEQPDVLDGDDSLVSEGFEKGNLLFGERQCLHPADC